MFKKTWAIHPLKVSLYQNTLFNHTENQERERDVCFTGAPSKVRVAACLKSGKKGSAF